MHIPQISTLIALAACVSAQGLTDVLSGDDSLSTLTQLLTTTNLTSQLGTDITILAPTNDAFDGVDTSNTTQVARLLSYHVIVGVFTASDFDEGDGTMAPTLLPQGAGNHIASAKQIVNAVRDGNDVTVYSGGKAASEVTQANIMFDNGVIHKIGSVLTLPDDPSVVASNTDGLSSLVAALMATNLVDDIDIGQNVTIFAPNNDALSAANFDSLSDNEKVNALQYHVIVGGVVYYSTQIARDVARGDGTARQNTLQHNAITFSMEDDSLRVNGAEIITPNVITSNGIIHIIGSVLDPAKGSDTFNGAGSLVGAKTGVAAGAAAVAIAALAL